MLRVARWAGLALIAAVLAGAAGPPPGLSAQPAVPDRHVIVLSVDGARADALQAVWPDALRQQGAASWNARTTLPSSTLPSHTSMVTGVGPEVHKVRFNDWDPVLPRLALPSIFTEVRRSGGTVRAIAAKAKLEFLVPERVPFTFLALPRYRQEDVVEAAARVFVEQRLTLLFVHVADPDDVGHRRGWMSEPYLEVIRRVPPLVARLLREAAAAGVLEQTLIIVTADHGGHGFTHGTARLDDVTIPWIALGGLVRAGAAIRQPIVTYDTAATVLYALGIPVPASWMGRPVLEALAVEAPVRR